MRIELKVDADGASYEDPFGADPVEIQDVFIMLDTDNPGAALSVIENSLKQSFGRSLPEASDNRSEAEDFRSYMQSAKQDAARWKRKYEDAVGVGESLEQRLDRALASLKKAQNFIVALDRLRAENGVRYPSGMKKKAESIVGRNL